MRKRKSETKQETEIPGVWEVQVLPRDGKARTNPETRDAFYSPNYVRAQQVWDWLANDVRWPTSLKEVSIF